MDWTDENQLPSESQIKAHFVVLLEKMLTDDLSPEARVQLIALLHNIRQR